MDYGKLNLKLTGRCIERRKLQRNTYAIRRKGSSADASGEIAVQLHRTDVLKFTRRNGGEFVTFNTGGWETVTTKERMNGYAPDGFGVYSTRGDWYLYGPGRRKDAPKDAAWWEARERWAFFSGITVNARTGRPLVEHAKQAEKLERERKETRNENARIERARKKHIKVCEALARCFSALTLVERRACDALADGLQYLFACITGPYSDVADMLRGLGESLEACYEVGDAPPADGIAKGGAVLAWHFINADWYTCHDGTAIRTGRTLRVRGNVIPCRNGLHASVRAIDAASFHQGPVACRVMVWGAIRHDTNKLAAEYRRVLYAVDATNLVNERYSMDADAFEAALEASPRIAGPHDE